MDNSQMAEDRTVWH